MGGCAETLAGGTVAAADGLGRVVKAGSRHVAGMALPRAVDLPTTVGPCNQFLAVETGCERFGGGVEMSIVGELGVEGEKKNDTHSFCALLWI